MFAHSMPAHVYILLGSNLGNREENLMLARQRISRSLGTIITASSIYCSAAWGNTQQPDFYNQVLLVESLQQPISFLYTVHQIESDLGRIRVERWGPRLIDIDILLWDSQVMNSPDLTIPHPGIDHRKFTLVPLAEIAGEIVHPVTGLTISQMLDACPDTLPILKL
jgi:2-amino-4-hydroxy-6-hydroxymethyldihydropteridine diphosphokinase